ncbi:terminal deoxynucleotidyl transferas-like protein [Lojkania enalia]|uniref:DNA polymerase lambda n=1 Tax=Lojkania enalia TaxID=147567 RepID=A0A9P4NBK2_9PLEO|nr:terminal deoxynucleotidyl transferas-like protein [Didymosphaeria enalia]
MDVGGPLSSQTRLAGLSAFGSSTLDLGGIPPIAILSAHLKGSEEKEVEETLFRHGACVTNDLSKVKVFIGKVFTKRRAEFELRSRKFKAEEIVEAKHVPSPDESEGPPGKRRRVGETSKRPITVHDEESTSQGTTEDEAASSKTEEERDTHVIAPPEIEEQAITPVPFSENHTNDDTVWVVKIDWLNECVIAGSLLPLGEHLVYKGRVLERPTLSGPKEKPIREVFSSPTQPASRAVLVSHPHPGESILERAKSDICGQRPRTAYQQHRYSAHVSRHFEGATFVSDAQKARHIASKTANILQHTTSEYEGEDNDIPPPPEWVKKRVKYACQRITPADSPNKEFIEQLKKIRTARTLINDEVGVRAYSTIIAAIAAYPYKITYPREIFRIPGCEDKAATLWLEWKNTGVIRAVEDFERDEAMKVLRLFYNIWGVGPKTAREFYYNYHWTEMDDIIEYGWDDLDRVQQIGVKYYDEFLVGIPRAEVEQIASIVRDHAVRARDECITVTIVGGYRRGKAESGDVDLIVSHPDIEATANLVKDIVESLEESEWITHTLTMSLNSTHRGQATLPFRTSRASGVGFDTLDKALVVWQDPNWPTKEADREKDHNARNPNIHRRVDIIVSPWRTVGCAVMGWSGQTTFQRDLRRYAKYVKGWKFDSSGIRSRSTGEVVLTEGPKGVGGTPEDAERTVFEALGLEYVPPEMRCTG